ncbi:RNA polymerase ECF family sigma subunit [Asanoa ferruginea]|uniref:RNA polymerase ECF family sigma subunit n=1 Tax=Asanoa ferruginea TaxID=53367 RepID=A0A3D9ZYJ3_9ACTN|nr:sigma-70 family RNA polymerase sigma factor [Asanoa ferruginea]REG01224.1 RNA polymerase ECF family sigma subunit [Asanoa ferruginea]GIF47066.1 RNA polymerase sigma factor [Asanoa ferruginea]
MTAQGVAVRPDAAEFARVTGPFRRELLAYGYRMLGSLPEAEDAVQETYLRAWRGFEGFDGRSSVRTWLYRIATNACLRAIERAGRRPLPSALVGGTDDVAWLGPVPDSRVLPDGGDPATLVAVRSSVRLALVAALQYLPARQRAVLILRDVLAWSAAETADLLDTTVPAVNSALQRAHGQLALAAPREDELTEPSEPVLRDRLERWMRAFETADAGALVGLMRHDIVFEMPPRAQWYAGREAVGRFLASTVLGRPGDWRAELTAANGRPAIATWLRGADGRHHGHGIQLTTVTAGGISHVVTFLDPALFPAFGLEPVR